MDTHVYFVVHSLSVRQGHGAGRQRCLDGSLAGVVAPAGSARAVLDTIPINLRTSYHAFIGCEGAR